MSNNAFNVTLAITACIPSWFLSVFDHASSPQFWMPLLLFLLGKIADWWIHKPRPPRNSLRRRL
jgi:hypothetical protein